MENFQEMQIKVLDVLGRQKNIKSFIKTLKAEAIWCLENKDFYTERQI